MLKYSANNQTFHRSKVEYLNWLNFTTKLEPVSNAKCEPSPPPSTAELCCAPPRIPFAYFLRFLRQDFWKRLFLVGSLSLCDTISI